MSEWRPFWPNPGWVLLRACGCEIDPLVFGHERLNCRYRTGVTSVTDAIACTGSGRPHGSPRGWSAARGSPRPDPAHGPAVSPQRS